MMRLFNEETGNMSEAIEQRVKNGDLFLGDVVNYFTKKIHQRNVQIADLRQQVEKLQRFNNELGANGVEKRAWSYSSPNKVIIEFRTSEEAHRFMDASLKD